MWGAATYMVGFSTFCRFVQAHEFFRAPPALAPACVGGIVAGMKATFIALLACLLIAGCTTPLPTFPTDFKSLKALAEKGNPDGQTGLGTMYRMGLGVEKDYAKAIEWYRKSAEQGDAFAQGNLGVMYRDGLGVEKDSAKAVGWFTKSAEQGDAYAQTNLGVFYVEGQVVEQNYVTAYAWWNIAATNGNQNAQKVKPMIAKEMTPAQIAKAEELVKEMVKKNPKLINKK